MPPHRHVQAIEVRQVRHIVSATLARASRAGEDAMRDRFRRAAQEGDLAPGNDPDGVARYIMTVSEGLAVHAAAGATRENLAHVVDLALRALPADAEGRAWPGSKKACGTSLR